MDSENNHKEEYKQEEESAGNRLRRILASNSKKQQELSDISSKPESEEEALPTGFVPDEEIPHISGEQELDSSTEEETLAPKERTAAKFWQNIKTIAEEFSHHAQEFLASLFRKMPATRQPADHRGKPPKKSFIKDKKSCAIYTILGFLLFVIIIAIIILSFLIIQYFRIAADLPSVENLADYASKFETTRIYDRNGNLIYEIIDPTAGRRTYVPLEEISPYIIAATIAT